MTLPASGAISLSQVATELQLSAALAMGHDAVRVLAGVYPSNAVSLSNLYGKTAMTLVSGTGTVFAPGYMSQGSSPGGSLTPNTYNGIFIAEVQQISAVLRVRMSQINLPQNFWNNLYINGVVFSSAAASSYIANSGSTDTQWDITAQSGMVKGGTYRIAFG